MLDDFILWPSPTANESTVRFNRLRLCHVSRQTVIAKIRYISWLALRKFFYVSILKTIRLGTNWFPSGTYLTVWYVIAKIHKNQVHRWFPVFIPFRLVHGIRYRQPFPSTQTWVFESAASANQAGMSTECDEFSLRRYTRSFFHQIFAASNNSIACWCTPVLIILLWFSVSWRSRYPWKCPDELELHELLSWPYTKRVIHVLHSWAICDISQVTSNRRIPHHWENLCTRKRREWTSLCYS